jgi:hypothetical protein
MSFEKDPVVQDVRKVRQEIFKEFGYDPHKFGKFLAEREKRLKKAEKTHYKRDFVASH